MATVEFWFEFASTYSYPAAMRIETEAAERGVAIAWRSFLLGPIFRAQGWGDSPFNIYPAKGRYMWRDLERVCQELQLPFRRPSVFPRNGLLAARIACRYAGATWLPAFVRATYGANFADDKDITSPGVIGECVELAGQAAGPILASADAPETKECLRAQTEAATQAGIFGAPSFVCGSELFWGNDRMESALEWCRRRAA